MQHYRIWFYYLILLFDCTRFVENLAEVLRFPNDSRSRSRSSSADLHENFNEIINELEAEEKPVTTVIRDGTKPVATVTRDGTKLANYLLHKNFFVFLPNFLTFSMLLKTFFVFFLHVALLFFVVCKCPVFTKLIKSTGLYFTLLFVVAMSHIYRMMSLNYFAMSHSYSIRFIRLCFFFFAMFNL